MGRLRLNSSPRTYGSGIPSDGGAYFGSQQCTTGAQICSPAGRLTLIDAHLVQVGPWSLAALSWPPIIFMPTMREFPDLRLAHFWPFRAFFVFVPRASGRSKRLVCFAGIG